MQRARSYFNATTLLDGRVLVVGGEAGRPVSAEIYDPATRHWTLTGRPRNTAYGTSPMVVLADGRVLVCGGYTDPANDPTAAAELFDPATGRWTATADMTAPRAGPSAIRLADGRVMVVGGAKSFAGRELPTTEIYDPAAGTWSPAAPMGTSRTNRAVALLPDGRVLVAGGGDPGAGTMGALFEAELYDPAADTWSPTAGMHTNRWGAAAIVLQDGSVLLVGGHTTGSFQFVGSAERFYPNGAPMP
jgi:N-acetylneuraminic acid mutarotase